MESTISASNIVAAAMSTANLMAPDSPKYSNESATLPQVSAISVPVEDKKYLNDIAVKTEVMEASDRLPSAHVLIRQEPQDSEPISQPLVNPNTVSPPIKKPANEEPSKEFVTRSDASSSQLISVTSTGENFTITTVNGSTKLPVSSNGSTTVDKSIISIVSSSGNHITMEVPTAAPGTPELNSGLKVHPKPSEDTVYPITCGPNRAELVWKRFICPGINAKCVKCGENWYTPKEFVALAGKSTLKDWKRAIRINGTMLRRLIENGELNYFEHETNCSSQCRSNKNNTSFDSNGEKSFDADSREPNGKEHSIDVANIAAPLPRSSSEEPNHHIKKTPVSTIYKSHDGAIGSSSLPCRNSLDRSSSEDSGLAASPHVDGMLMREVPATFDKVQDLERFWNSVARLDFFDEIVCDIMGQIKGLHGRVKIANSCNVEDVVMLTNLVNSLEMFPNILHRMSLHKHKVEKETEESNHAIQELEKRLAEQKKHDQDLKRKSRHLDNVMLLTPNEKRQKRNIIRIGRQKAIDSRIPPGTTAPSIPGADIRENVMLAAAGRAGIGHREMWPGHSIQVDSLARAAATSQMAAHMNNTAQAAISAGLPPFSIFPQLRTPTDVLTPLQAFVPSPQGSRESTQSPKK